MVTKSTEKNSFCLKILWVVFFFFFFLQARKLLPDKQNKWTEKKVQKENCPKDNTKVFTFSH